MTSEEDSGGLWTVHDVARFLKASTSWTYKAAERGELPCIRIGAMLRFEPEAISAWVRNRGRQTLRTLHPAGR